MIAHDTRPSGPGLADAAAAGVRSLGVTPEMCGLLTTPQLHWMVRRRNAGLPYDEAAYLQVLSSAFKQLVAGTQPLGQVRHSAGAGAGVVCSWLWYEAGERMVQLPCSNLHAPIAGCQAIECQGHRNSATGSPTCSMAACLTVWLSAHPQSAHGPTLTCPL